MTSWSLAAPAPTRHRRSSTVSAWTLGLAATLALSAGSAQAQPPAPPATLVDDAVVAELRSWLDTPIVAMSIAAQNDRHRAIAQGAIDALDAQWRAERDARGQPLIASTLGRPLSSYLTRIQAHALGLFTEIFVMDSHGLNVGQSAVTSDYWQGDEAKFQNTFAVGPGAVFIDDPEYHEGSGTWRIQVNLTLDDPDTGRPAGAATVEINLTELARRAALPTG